MSAELHEEEEAAELEARLSDRFPGRQVQIKLLLDMLHEVS